ncbi:hypothetical protein BS47DRAFT_187436 [Hydnum rufescens UP504]|uniref:Uncharacterized protein n=1 Tax=Hydnum rufescens UP504 TaxID=1448309 RepID=A0A9P6AN71_9AGAM|nr:hypothetical protein BS47DRAFT_187436 [Hydnum rufescens UP504]
MPSRGLSPPRGRSVQSSLPPSNDSPPNGASTSTLRPATATAPQPGYSDYITGRGLDVALVMSRMIRDMPGLPPTLSGPLSQVFHVLANVTEAVKTMGDGRDRCTQLMVRVTRFLEVLVDGLKGKNIDDTRAASSLHILRRNLMTIHADARQWSRLNLVKRYLQRDKIMNAIARHDENLTDYFHTLQIMTFMTESSPLDRAETIAPPGPPVSGRPLAGSENTLVRDLQQPADALLSGMRDLLESPASHAVFEQIGMAVQDDWRRWGYGPSTPVGSRARTMKMNSTRG